MLSSPPPSILQDAWNAAQPRLNAIKSTLLPHTSTQGRVMRVSQLDSELLDQELVRLLQEPLTGSLSLLSSRLKAGFEAELRLIIQLILYKFSIWDVGASYGSKLQGLRYIELNSAAGKRSPSGLRRKTLALHGVLTLIIPYFHDRLRNHALSHAWPDRPSSDARRKAWLLVATLESIHGSLALLNFVAFLWNGSYRTLADRLLKLRLTPSNGVVTRDVSYEFMNRQMVWHAFTEFLLFLLPLINARTFRKRISRAISSLSAASTASLRSLHILPTPSRVESWREGKPIRRGKFASLPEDQCAICAENASFNLNPSDSANAFASFAAETSSAPTAATHPIQTPYQTSCGHLYCYHCIADRIIRLADGDDDEAGWECLRCGELINDVRRYSVEVIESDPSGSDYGFSSDIELGTELSGSFGSYSESMLSD